MINLVEAVPFSVAVSNKPPIPTVIKITVRIGEFYFLVKVKDW